MKRCMSKPPSAINMVGNMIGASVPSVLTGPILRATSIVSGQVNTED
jgi:hypothetical protein